MKSFDEHCLALLVQTLSRNIIKNLKIIGQQKIKMNVRT